MPLFLKSDIPQYRYHKPMMYLKNTRSTQTAKPKLRVKKGDRNSVTVVREGAHTGEEDFTYFVVT
jgi:hypothetical protein